MIEITEWNFWPLMDHELETSDSTLKVEIGIMSERGEMSARALYFALYDRDDKLVMDDHRARRRDGDPLWRLVDHLVAEAYDDRQLDRIQAENPAFEHDNVVAMMQRRMDNEWYRSTVL